jgi:hypothetical protein
MTDDPHRDGEEGVWRLGGYDTFDRHDYGLDGRYASRAEAEAAARERLAHLERIQPSASSGGQGRYGIQDRVYIIAPDGSVSRFTG